MKAPAIILIFGLLFVQNFVVTGQTSKDTLKFAICLNYTIDLSDTYGGGEMLTGEFSISKSWYGASLSYGHFISQSDFIFKVPLEESGYTLEIPFQEMALMRMGIISVEVIPIQGKWISAELGFGVAYARSEFLCAKGVEYNFDPVEEEFTWIMKDYQLTKSNHFGYQVGFKVSFFPLKKVGLQLNSRIQDLSNGGTFFFVGGGFCFNL